MNTKKRLVAFALTVILLFGLLPATALAIGGHDNEVRVIVENTTFTEEAGDEICVMYTQDYGEDIGGSWNNNDKRVKEVSFSAGTVEPDFDKDTHDYTLTLPEGTEGIVVTPTAMNKNFQARTSVGGTEYKRNATVPVENGTVIKVTCGLSSWPTMNDAGGVPAEMYRFTVLVEGETFSVSTSSSVTNGTLNVDNDAPSAGDTVVVTPVPGEGYRFKIDSLYYKDEAGQQTNININDEDIYSFVMPQSDVTLYGVFEEMVTPDVVSFTISPHGGDPITVECDETASNSTVILPCGTEYFDLSYVLAEGTELSMRTYTWDFGYSPSFYGDDYLNDIFVGTYNKMAYIDMSISITTYDWNTAEYSEYMIIVKRPAAEFNEQERDKLRIEVQSEFVSQEFNLDLASGQTDYDVDLQSIYADTVADYEVTIKVYPLYADQNANPITIINGFDDSELAYMDEEPTRLSPHAAGWYYDKQHYLDSGYMFKTDVMGINRGQTVTIPLTITIGEGESAITKTLNFTIDHTGYTTLTFEIVDQDGEPVTDIGNDIDLNDDELSSNCITWSGEYQNFMSVDLYDGDHTFVFASNPNVSYFVENEVEVPVTITNTPGEVVKMGPIQVTLPMKKREVNLNNVVEDAEITVVSTRTGLEYEPVEGNPTQFLMTQGEYTYDIRKGDLIATGTIRVQANPVWGVMNVNVPDMVLDPEIAVAQINALGMAYLGEETYTYGDGSQQKTLYIPDFQNIRVEATLTDPEGTTYVLHNENDRNKITLLKQAYQTDVVFSFTVMGTDYASDPLPLSVPASTFVITPAGDMDLELVRYDTGEAVEDGSVIYMPAFNRSTPLLVIRDKEGKSLSGYMVYHEINGVAGGGTAQDRLAVKEELGSQGRHEVEAWLQDEDGNKTESCFATVYVDTLAPEATIAVDNPAYLGSSSSGTYTSQPITLTVTAQDVTGGGCDYCSGISGEAYSFDAGNTWQAENTLVISDYTSIEPSNILVRDALGNEASVTWEDGSQQQEICARRQYRAHNL